MQFHWRERIALGFLIPSSSSSSSNWMCWLRSRSLLRIVYVRRYREMATTKRTNIMLFFCVSCALLKPRPFLSSFFQRSMTKKQNKCRDKAEMEHLIRLVRISFLSCSLELEEQMFIFQLFSQMSPFALCVCAHCIIESFFFCFRYFFEINSWRPFQHWSS